MLRISIFNSDLACTDRLVHHLKATGLPFKLISICHTGDEASRSLNTNRSGADLLFIDMRLASSLSGKLRWEIQTPAVFITDNHSEIYCCSDLSAIDYLVRPVTYDILMRSLNRFERLKNHFSSNLNLSPAALSLHGMPYRERVIVKKGPEYQSIRTEDVACFFTDQKLVFLVDKEGKKYLTDVDNLTDLSLQLNKKLFFRANRKYIININYIKKYRTCDRVKLEVELSLQNPETVMISQENSGCFRQWIESL